jgi:hypothetical protein
VDAACGVPKIHPEMARGRVLDGLGVVSADACSKVGSFQAVEARRWVMRRFLSGLCFSSVVLLAMSFHTSALGGQYKTLDASHLNIGEEIAVHSSPMNSGRAMEIDVYEWMAARSVVPLYICRIVANNTGRTLNLSMIDVTANNIISSCSAPRGGGACETPFQVHPEIDIKLLCIVGTENNSPVRKNAHYVFAIRRTQ